MNNKYDLCVIFRCYPWISKTPRLFSDSKSNMIFYSLKSLKLFLWNLKVFYIIICDWCAEEIILSINKALQGSDFAIHEFEKLWNFSSFQKQLDIAIWQTYSKNIYLCEDDYLYDYNNYLMSIDAINLLIQKKSHYITFFDFPGNYNIWNIHHYFRKKLFISDANFLWATWLSTTLTFLTTREILIEDQKYRRKFGRFPYWIWGGPIRMILTKQLPLFYIFDFNKKKQEYIKWIPVSRIYLWMCLIYWLIRILVGSKRILLYPVPSWSTHLEGSDVAHNVSRENIAKGLNN